MASSMGSTTTTHVTAELLKLLEDSTEQPLVDVLEEEWHRYNVEAFRAGFLCSVLGNHALHESRLQDRTIN